MTIKTTQFPSIKDVPTPAWKKLAQKKIYFGHQSVGFNIMDGVKDIMKEYPEIKLNIVETADQSDFKIGLLAHSRVGKNVDPKSKIDEFTRFINEGIGQEADVVALKFCYVDMTTRSEVENILTDYSDSMMKLKKRYPDITIVHFTEPLTSIQTGPKAWIKNIIGRPIGGVDDNIKRNVYNEMLLRKYNGNEPVFNIAKIQSTFPDGTRATFFRDGKTYHYLVPDYTYDGGHLNEKGRKIVAEQLLILLANLEK